MFFIATPFHQMERCVLGQFIHMFPKFSLIYVLSLKLFESPLRLKKKKFCRCEQRLAAQPEFVMLDPLAGQWGLRGYNCLVLYKPPVCRRRLRWMNNCNVLYPLCAHKHGKNCTVGQSRINAAVWLIILMFTIPGSQEEGLELQARCNSSEAAHTVQYLRALLRRKGG